MILPFLCLIALTANSDKPQLQDSTAILMVRVRHDAAPVPGASVRAAARTTITDVRGEARVRLALGSQVVEVVRLGFADTTVVVPVHAGSDNAIAIELREVALEQEAIVATATRSGAIVSEQPIRIEAVPTEEIHENLTVAPGNLTTLLEELPGVRIAPTAPGLGGASLRMRGLPGRMTQILIDGLPLLGTEPDAFSMLQTPPLDLARVEVVKGVASALYGGAATAGILNLVSKTPHEDSQLLLNRSSRQESDAAAFLAHEFSAHWGTTLSAGGSDRVDKDVDHDGWAELPAYRRVVLRPRLFWHAGPNQSVLATASFTHETRRGGTLHGSTLPDGSVYRTSLTTRRVDTGASAHVLLRSSWLLRARATAMQQDHDRQLGTTTENDRLNTGLAEISLSRSSAAQTWLLGASMDYDAFRVAANRSVDYTYRTPAIFAQDEYSPADWLSTSISARVDFNNEFGTFFSPRGAVLLRAAQSLSFRASAGTGWAPPRPVTDEVASIGYSHVVPVAHLQPERVRNASLDVDWHTTRLELSVGAFTAEIQHPLAERRMRTSAGELLQLYNLPAPQQTRGMELLLHVRAAELQLLGSYTYLFATEQDSVGGRRLQDGLPRHAAEIGAIVEDEQRGRAGLEIGYTGRMRLEDDPYRTTSKPYWEINVLAARYFGESELFVNALNLLNVRQSDFEPLLRPAHSDPLQPATPVWGPLAGRLLNVGVRIEL